MTYAIIEKDPTENISVDVDWVNWLDGDTIVASSWTAPTSITIDAEQNTTTVTSVWLTGGTLREHYNVKNTITTASGRITTRTVVVRLVSK